MNIRWVLGRGRVGCSFPFFWKGAPAFQFLLVTGMVQQKQKSLSGGDCNKTSYELEYALYGIIEEVRVKLRDHGKYHEVQSIVRILK